MMLRYLASASLLCATCLDATQSGAATLPDGVYKCILSFTESVGSIAIDGRSYQGPAFNGKYTRTYPFDLTDAGEIIWGGPLGLLSSRGNIIGRTKLIDPVGGFAGFNIFLRTRHGVSHSANCEPT